MSVSYVGLYLFPTDAGQVPCPMFRATTTRSNTFASDVEPVIREMTALEAGCFSVNNGEYIADTDSPVGLTEISTFYGQTLSLSRSLGNWNVMYNNTSQGTFHSITTTSGKSSSGCAIIVECSDGYVMMNTQFAQDTAIGVAFTLPYDNRMGYWAKEGQYNYIVGMPNLLGEYQKAINAYFLENPPLPIGERDTDPYGGGGYSGGGGGTGDLDGTSDNISFPNLPTLSAVNSGFVTAFVPSLADMQALSNYMWSTAFDFDQFKKIFANPMDCIIGLNIVPVAIPLGGTRSVNIGNIITTITMPYASTQYVSVPCGSINVNEYWGAYLDYSPYTKVYIYLPYIGTRPLNADDVMNKTVEVLYHVDILSGSCTAFVKCGNSVLYTFIGQCASQIPVTNNDMSNIVHGAITIAGAIGSMVATGGMSAPISAGAIASIASTAMTMKPDVEKSGAMGGTGGMLGIQVPYLIVTRPRQALPQYQNKFIGYPSFITKYLGDLRGYTEIDSIHLENVPCTEAELQEIESILKSGVIL